MNAIDMTGLKVFACGVVAVAVTLVGSYAFVASTAVVRSMGAPTHVVANMASTRLAGIASSGLLQ